MTTDTLAKRSTHVRSVAAQHKGDKIRYRQINNNICRASMNRRAGKSGNARLLQLRERLLLSVEVIWPGIAARA
jgi:hypothetical protein